MNDKAIEAKLDDFFQVNYQRLLSEGGAHVLTPRALAQARQQVEHYWKKMRDVAVNVTDTEVRLQLANQKTPQGRPFVIEGVVDLVREADRVRMYDIKTHYCLEVQSNLASYKAQLNLYAYVWRALRGQEVREMGVIAIQLPESLRQALRESRFDDARRELTSWNPLVSIEVDPDAIEGVFADIARVVDRIEDGEFEPPPVATLREIKGKDPSTGRKLPFATLHCRNCDGRFSCVPYREYVSSGKGTRSILTDLLEDVDELERHDWKDGNIELDLDRLFPED